MKIKLTLALAALALVAGAFLLRRSWAVSWPQAGYTESQTAYNPVDTLLEPIPDLYWWSGDVDVSSLSYARGKAWSPVEIDFGVQGVPDPVLACGRQNQVAFYHPNLPQGLKAGANTPVLTITLPGPGAGANETGLLTTNPVVAERPGVPTNFTTTSPTGVNGQSTPSTGARMLFVTYGLGLQTAGITADDPAYVQAITVSSAGANFSATVLGRLHIQQPLANGGGRETRITGMTYADIGDSTDPLPLLFLTTADGEVICVDTRVFANTSTNQAIDPGKAIRWRWINPGPRVVVPPGGGTPVFPRGVAQFQPVPFNDGMNPAVGQVALNGLPDLPSLADSARKTNQNWQTQIQAQNRDWMVFVADRAGNGWGIEAFGETKNVSPKPGQQLVTFTGKAKTRWRVTIPGGAGFPARFAVPPVFWNGNTPTSDANGNLTGQNNGWKDEVVFAGVNHVVAYDAQGNFLTADAPVFWDESQIPAGQVPSLPAGSTLPPLTRKLGDADGTTQLRWQFPEAGANAPAEGSFPVTVIRAMAGWAGPRQLANNNTNFANTEDDDDRIFLRWNETYVPNVDRTTAIPTEPQIPAPAGNPQPSYVERLGAVFAYGSVETTQPIDKTKPVLITFKKTVGMTSTTYTIPPQYISVLPEWTDNSSTDGNNRPKRGRITITKQVGLDDMDQPVTLVEGDALAIQYTPQGGSATTTEANVTFPSRLGREVEPGSNPPKAGTVVPTSIGIGAGTLESENPGNPSKDEFITPSLTADDYNPSASDITRSGVNPGMSIANDNIYLGSRYRGRLYVVEAVSLLLRGEMINGNLETPSNGAAPGPDQSFAAAAPPIGNPAIADGWLYADYSNGFLAGSANVGGGASGAIDDLVPDRPFVTQFNRNAAIPIPQIRVTDQNGTPITSENQLRYDWGQPVKLSITFPADAFKDLSAATNPIRVTIRGPMGDLPPVTVSPARQTLNGQTAGVATPEIIIPNASPSNPMTPGTPLLMDTPINRRAGTAHWELRVEQIGTNWLKPDPANPNDPMKGTIGPWEPDREAATWDPSNNTAPWFTLNNPIALAYQAPNGGSTSIAMVTRFSTAPPTVLYQAKNGDPYQPNQPGDVKKPDVITVGVDPATGQQLLLADHGKASPSLVLQITDRSDLGLRPNLGALKVRIEVPKVTKLGFPLTNNGAEQSTGVRYGSIDQNEPDDGPDGYYPSIPGNRLNVVKIADATNAASDRVSLRGAVSDPNNPQAPPITGPDGFEAKHLVPEPFNVTVDIPQYQPDGVYATRARAADPSTATGGGSAVPSPATAVDPRKPYLDYAPDDPNADVNNPPFSVGINDRTARVTVFVDANNNGRLDLQGNYREAFRTFAVQVIVKPDMRLDTLAVSPRTGALSRLMDLGKLWHGFASPSWTALGKMNSQAQTFFEQYWKPFVIRNTGNVNLVRVKPEVAFANGNTLGPVRLPSDGVDLFDSLELARDPSHDRNVNLSDPSQIFLRTSFDDSLGLPQGRYGKGGAWLQKARPGASSPGTGLYNGNPAGANAVQYEPKLTLNIPMGSPLGTYAGDVRFFNDRQWALVRDPGSPLGWRYEQQAIENDGFLNRTVDPNSGQIIALEPYSDPTMSVKVKVTENLAAGSTADPMVLSQAGVQGGLARTSPGAGLDAGGDQLLLFYASNQDGLKSSPAQPMRFDIFGTAVTFDKNTQMLPFDLTPLSGTDWTNPVPISAPAAVANSLVKNTSPSFAQDPRPAAAGAGRLGYVFWQQDLTDNQGQNQARILYRQVTPTIGGVQVLAPGGKAAETGAVREAPRAVAVPTANGLKWFVFWNGSDQAKGNLFFSTSTDPNNPATWTAESVVPTSPSLATVSGASPVYLPTTDTLWLFYNGFSQRLGRSDMYATKLNPAVLGTQQTVSLTAAAPAPSPNNGLLGFSPNLGDILRANPNRTSFTATGVDWRVDAANPLAVFINGYLPVDKRPNNMPANGLELYISGQAVTKTNQLTYRGPSANGELTWSFQWPLKNSTNPVTVYIAVDTAAGTIRFSQPPGALMLPGVTGTAKLHQDPQVVADYIPGSLRLTTSEQGATGGVGFVTSSYEPSWYWNTKANSAGQKLAAPIGARADRIWSVWRRAGSATTLGPTLYYKAFRPGIQLITPLVNLAGGTTFYNFNVQDAPGVDPRYKNVPLVLEDVDLQHGALYFDKENEGRKVIVTATDNHGNQVVETHYISWRQEGTESPVPLDVAVNEGTVSAFPRIDPVMWSFIPVGVNGPVGNAAQNLPHLDQIWLFWTSTRGSGSDIFHATIAPRLTPVPG